MHYIISAYFCALLATPHQAFAGTAAQASGCYNIADADARAYCLARAHRDSSRCYSIQQAHLRSLCLAEIRK